MNVEDRPINPDKKYLEQFIQKISKVETKPYLKKKSQPFLPCQLHCINSSKQKQKKMREAKTKAEVYQQIKRKNREKFGQKKVDEVVQKVLKKIDPKKMTVNYRPKQKYPIIDVQQYKKQGKVKGQSKLASTEANHKIQYQKLLDYLNDEIKNLQKEKEQFNKDAAKLKYKDFISKQDGLSFAKIKSQVQKQLITQVLSEKGSSNMQMNEKKVNETKVQLSKKIPSKITNNFIRSHSIEQIQDCMIETTQKMRQIKLKLLQKSTQVNEHRYDISQIHILPAFDPQTLYDYIDPSKLKYNGNDNYVRALSSFNTKFHRQNQEDVCGNVQKQQTLKKQIAVKFIGEKRVMKYDGWTQVWIPGRQRLMANNEGYKVIWLSNGDVLQQFPNNISTYYSKAKRICKISYEKMAPVYYHRDSGQLWRQMDDDSREIVFGNGRREQVRINVGQES